MSEDKERKIQESRAVTSDKNNTASLYAVNKSAGKDAVPKDTDLTSDDEILELIRKRRKKKREKRLNLEGQGRTEA